MKSFIRKIWDALVKLIYKVPFDKWLHFMAGLIIAAFFNITLGVEGCFWAALFAGALKEMFDIFTTGTAEWKDLLATVLGGGVIQLFVLL